MKRGDGLWLALAIATAAVTSVFDLPSDEVIVPLAFLLPLTFLMGFGRPAGAWRWGVIAGLGVPAGRLVADWLALPVRDPSPVHEGLVALVPALVGTYAGVAARTLLAAMAGRDSSARG